MHAYAFKYKEKSKTCTILCVTMCNTKGTFQILLKFLVKKSFNIQELLHHKSKPHETKAHAFLLVKYFECFPKTSKIIPRTQSEASHFGGSHNYKTKQTTFLHR